MKSVSAVLLLWVQYSSSGSSDWLGCTRICISCHSRSYVYLVLSARSMLLICVLHNELPLVFLLSLPDSFFPRLYLTWVLISYTCLFFICSAFIGASCNCRGESFDLGRRCLKKVFCFQSAKLLPLSLCLHCLTHNVLLDVLHFF